MHALFINNNFFDQNIKYYGYDSVIKNIFFHKFVWVLLYFFFYSIQKFQCETNPYVLFLFNWQTVNACQIKTFLGHFSLSPKKS